MPNWVTGTFLVALAVIYFMLAVYNSEYERCKRGGYSTPQACDQYYKGNKDGLQSKNSR